MSRDDLAVIAMLWLALCNLGYDIQDLDLNEPSYIKRDGPHTIYSFSILIRDDENFKKEEFCRLLSAYSEHSRIKVNLYSLEEYPGHATCVCYDDEMDAIAANALKIMRNFTTIYVRVYV